MFLMFLAAIGFVTVIGFVGSATITAIQWILSPSGVETVITGAPWFAVGGVIGFILGVAHMDENNSEGGDQS